VSDETGGEGNADLESRLQELLDKAVSRGRYVRHGLLGVADSDGSWQWTGSAGALDPEGSPATADARYPVASVTKLYTAAATMRLVEKRDLSLDTRIVEILPDAITAGLHVLDGVDHTGEITVEHLLGHTSGLPDYYEEAPAGGTSAQARLLAGEDAPMPFEDVLAVVREMTPHFAPQPTEAARRKARYTDTNYQLLGAVIESVTESPLPKVFDEQLFGPLGLDATSSYPHAPRNGRSPEPDARIWSKDTVLRPEGALTHQTADGGIISTLDDQIRFMRALIGGGVFEEAGTWARMHARYSRVFFPVDYGLGVMRYAPPRWMSPLFRIPELLGHTGSTATWLFHCPELDVILAGTFDVAQPPLPFRFLPRVLRAIDQRRP
jgi:D-alanyl-D-alanine carboxypeptidase